MTRDRDVWHFPKRADLTEFKDTITLLKRDEFQGATWNGNTQERLASLLDQEEITNDHYGRITPSSVRTLAAAMKYFGLVRKDGKTLKITNAGKRILKEDMNQVFREQFLKLQITNPNITRFCKEVRVFPFRVILRTLLDLDYLTRNEVGYFLIRFKGDFEERDLQDLIEEIKEFRNKSEEERDQIISSYKESKTGSWALDKAPISNYIMNFCEMSDLCLRNDKNGNRVLKLNKSKSEIKKILSEYSDNTFEFESKDVWNYYIGNPEIKDTPQNFEIHIETSKGGIPSDRAVKIYREIGNSTKIIDEEGKVEFKLFPEFEYKYEIYDKNAEIIKDHTLDPNKNLTIEIPDNDYREERDLESLYELVTEITSNSGYDTELETKLDILRKIDNYRVGSKKQVRGGRLEQLFNLIFEKFERQNLVDGVIWYGKTDENGVPQPAPGKGQYNGQGTPDIEVIIDDKIFVVELTHIKAERSQWAREGSSVPDHISAVESHKENKKITGLFVAPIIPEGNRDKMRTLVEAKNNNIEFAEIELLLAELRNVETKEEMKEALSSSSIQ